MGNVKQGVWNAESIRRARKSRGLTQAELAEGLGCRQQTISEWELGMYEPKNAYQKLLGLFFGSTPVVSEEVPAQNVWENERRDEVARTEAAPVAPAVSTATTMNATPAIDTLGSFSESND